MSTLDVVALAARTPVGLLAETSAAAVRAGISGLSESPYILNIGEPVTVAHDRHLDQLVSGRARLGSLLASVIFELERKLADVWPKLGGARVLLVVPSSRPGFSDEDATWLVVAVHEHLRAHGLDAHVQIAGRGHAGGIVAVRQAMADQEQGAEVVFIVIGVDSYLDLQTLAWLEQECLLWKPLTTTGFVPGEAAAALVLMKHSLRRRLALPRLAVVRSAAVECELHSRASDEGSLGVGLTQAVLEAAEPLNGAVVDNTYIDINGERYRSEEWGFMVLRTPGVWRSLEYDAPCDSWGDVGAAWAPLAGVLAARSFVRDYARGPRAMILAGSFDGSRGAMLFEAAAAQ